MIGRRRRSDGEETVEKMADREREQMNGHRLDVIAKDMLGTSRENFRDDDVLSRERSRLRSEQDALLTCK